MLTAKLSWFHYRLALVLGCVLFVDGYDLFNAGFVAAYVRQEWQLGDGQVGLMLSIGIAGLALGAYLQAPISEWIGRRMTIVVGVALLAIVSGCIASLVSDFREFVALRFVLGLTLGMLSPLAFVYVNEWAPAKSANRFAAIAFVLPFSFGGIAAGVAAMTIGPVFGWRGLYWPALIGVPIALLCFYCLPESMVRLVRQGRIGEIRAQLGAVNPECSTSYSGQTKFRLPETTRGSNIAKLFNPEYRWTTIGIWAASALSLLSLHGISGWLPTLLVSNGQAFASAFGFSTLLMTMQILGGSLCGVLADRAGRTGVMTMGFIGSALSITAMGIGIGSGWMALAVAAAGFCIFGTQAVMNNFTAMSYNPALRATGTGAAVAFSRVGGFAGPLLIGWSLSVGSGLWFTFTMLALTQVAAAVIMVLLHRGQRQGTVSK